MSQTYFDIEYEETTRQWYFIQQDTRTSNWIATQPVPQTYGLGRASIRASNVAAAQVDDDSNTGHNTVPTDMATTTQSATETTTAAAALTLANTNLEEFITSSDHVAEVQEETPRVEGDPQDHQLVAPQEVAALLEEVVTLEEQAPEHS